MLGFIHSVKDPISFQTFPSLSKVFSENGDPRHELPTEFCFDVLFLVLTCLESIVSSLSINYAPRSLRLDSTTSGAYVRVPLPEV